MRCRHCRSRNKAVTIQRTRICPDCGNPRGAFIVPAKGRNKQTFAQRISDNFKREKLESISGHLRAFVEGDCGHGRTDSIDPMATVGLI